MHPCTSPLFFTKLAALAVKNVLHLRAILGLGTLNGRHGKVSHMMKPPPQPANSFRVKLELTTRQRIDNVLLAELKRQDDNSALKGISRTAFKQLFKEKRIMLKGQSAVPSSLLATGITYVDILGFK